MLTFHSRIHFVLNFTTILGFTFISERAVGIQFAVEAAFKAWFHERFHQFHGRFHQLVSSGVVTGGVHDISKQAVLAASATSKSDFIARVHEQFHRVYCSHS